MILFPMKFRYIIKTNKLDNDKLVQFLKENNIEYTISKTIGLKWCHINSQIYPTKESFFDRWREE